MKEKLTELRFRLTSQRTTLAPVKFLLSTEDTAWYLLTALQVEVQARGYTLVINSEIQGHIQKLAEFFTCPTTKFGIMLCGGIGNGKSTMMRALQNLLNYFRIPISRYTSDYWGMRIESAKYLCHQIRTDPNNLSYFQELRMIGIDDLGEEEPEMMDYGNRVTPLIDLMSYRYDHMLFTMVTTNLTPPQIRTVYGDRIADRFNEMMLIIPYMGPSFRTKSQHSSINIDE